jgi:hypothetical protein
MIRFCIARKTKNKKCKSLVNKLNNIDEKKKEFILKHYFERGRVNYAIKFFEWRETNQHGMGDHKFEERKRRLLMKERFLYDGTEDINTLLGDDETGLKKYEAELEKLKKDLRKSGGKDTTTALKGIINAKGKQNEGKSINFAPTFFFLPPKEIMHRLIKKVTQMKEIDFTMPF